LFLKTFRGNKLVPCFGRGLVLFRQVRIDREEVSFLARIDVQGVQDTISILRKYEPELYKQLIKDIKNEPGLNEAMSGIRSKVPSISPLSGMNNDGKTGFKTPKVSTSVTPSKRLNFANQRSIVTIQTVSPKNGFGFEIIDLVGRGKNGNTPKARGMISKLSGQPSRFVWKGFEERQEGVTRAVVSILEKYAKTVNVKLKVK
jgi:hypothetical protein